MNILLPPLICDIIYTRALLPLYHLTGAVEDMVPSLHRVPPSPQGCIEETSPTSQQQKKSSFSCIIMYGH